MKACPSVSIFLPLMPFEIKCVEGNKARCTVLTDKHKGGYFLLKQFFFFFKSITQDYDKCALSFIYGTNITSQEINKRT